MRALPVHLWIVVLLGALCALLYASNASANHASPQKVQQLRSGIDWHRQQTWYWEGVAFRPRTKSAHHEMKSHSVHYLRWMARHWSKRRLQARHHAHNPPNLSAWLCIHSGEGAWTSNTGNGYYGGMQMDYGFMSTYGGHLLARKGTADHWTPLEQIWVAERARASGRGFYPWPTTARRCGLI